MCCGNKRSFSSHRFNPWIFSEREGVVGPNYASFKNPLPREYDKEAFQIASDARLDYLLNEFVKKQKRLMGEREEIRDHKIGAVIFTGG